jgi:hypothetical protein
MFGKKKSNENRWLIPEDKPEETPYDETSRLVHLFFIFLLILQTIVFMYCVEIFYEERRSEAYTWYFKGLIWVQFVWTGLAVIGCPTKRRPLLMTFLFCLTAWIGMFGLWNGLSFLSYFSIFMYFCLIGSK